MREYVKRKYHKRRAEAKAFLGGKCVHCGTTESLEFDHVDPKTKLYNSKAWSGIKTEAFWEEIKKCQLLCTTCHVKKTRVDGGLEPDGSGQHGVSGYTNHKCRCATCRRIWNEYCKAQKDKAKLQV